MEDDLPLVEPAGRKKLSRLRKAGSVPKAALPPSPFDQNLEPNEARQQQLPTPGRGGLHAGSPSSSRPAQDEAAEQLSGRADSPGERATAGRAGAGYRDEEDELEEYFEKGSEQGDDGRSPAGSDDEEGDRSHAGSEEEEEEEEEGSGAWGADVDADTQRVLRETASRDRLGQGAVVEVKPLSSILDKIKQRQQVAIQRAPKPNLINAPSFEEVFAAAQRGKGPTSAAVAAGAAAAAPTAGPSPAVPSASGSRGEAAAESALEAGAAAATAEAAEDGTASASQQGAPALLPTQVVEEGAAEALVPSAGRAQPSPPRGSPQQGLAGPSGEQEQHAAVMGSGAQAQVQAVEEEEEDDFEIVSQGSDGVEEAKIVELPSTTKKKKPAPFWTQTQDFENEVLIDDGYNSEEELVEAWSEPSSAEAGSEAEEAGSEEEEEVEEEEEEALSSDGEEGAAEPPEAAEGEQRGPEADGEGEEGAAASPAAARSPAAGSMEADMEDAEAAAGEDKGGTSAPPASAEQQKKRQPKLKRLFLDMEAELSDEGEGAVDSGDEEEDDLDDQGELADLIGKAQETRADRRRREELHRQWAEQRDAKELQQVLRGLKNGFRRRRGGGFMDEEDGEEGGRRRRARLEDNDGDDLPMGDDGGAGVPWFQDAAGSDEDADDMDLLKRAQERHALGDSQQEELAHVGSVPLDEGSQEVLSLLARSASEPQIPHLPPRSRFAPPGPVLGSEPAGLGGGSGGTGRMGRGLSFLGRQPSAQRQHGSGLASISSRSFVFGREDSNSALPAEKTQMAGGREPGLPPVGPTSFANLRQLTDTTGATKAPAAGSSLVSRLAAPKHRPGKEPVGSQGGGDGLNAADLVFEQVVAPKQSSRR